ncbi:MAG: TlpA disulfide reductase family protein [Sorangiineae bacterium]|nr:TlpA disulfide reductase family protein [Polyangiaceae bacterium]MEB2321309.1 TlpA disulfide reductase family protein [Sorangiineae bacterium]
MTEHHREAATSAAPKAARRGGRVLSRRRVVLALGAALVVGVILPRVWSRRRARAVPAPDFVLPVIYNGEEGSRVRLSDARGSAVLLDFWASWCGPCQEQAPIVDELARRYRARGLVVLGIDTGDEQEAAIRWAQSRKLSYAVAFDGGEVAAAYRVEGLPTLVVIDRRGRIVATRTRVVSEAELSRLVDEALAE